MFLTVLVQAKPGYQYTPHNGVQATWMGLIHEETSEETTDH